MLAPIFAAFRNSMAGLRDALQNERAVRTEFVLLALAVPFALIIGVGVWQRVAMIGVLLLTLAVELLNTCAEKLCDHVTPETHPRIKVIKDMGSAAVFCMLCLSALVWLAALAERLTG